VTTKTGLFVILVASLVRVTPIHLAPGVQLYGPTPYKSFADSPFRSLSLASFHLEDFEDHLFNAPGAAADVGIVASSQFAGLPVIDSVDGDDGNPTNGTCVGCDSFFNGNGAHGITFVFDPQAPGGLPTHAGIVWTDGSGFTRFEAFDASGVSLGVIGPVPIADNTFDESTGEDRFFGASNEEGISSIRISNSSGGIEVDHLQYGHLVTCVDRDGDGYGFPGGDATCPAGPAEDCNDANARISPAEGEVFDGLDDNCNGLIDEGLDVDGDGVPNFRDLCNIPSPGAGVGPDGCSICLADADGDGFQFTMDCNDGDPQVNPGAIEKCNGIDDNCDGHIDEGFDTDHDGFTVCHLDCNDLDPAIHPGVVELPGNVIDENCDGSLGTCDPRAVWTNHGEFVRCVSSEVGLLVSLGQITDLQGDLLVQTAAQSSVGK